MKLFQGLVEYQQIEKWVPLLEWLLSNDRFSAQNGWGKKKKRSFTSQVKDTIGRDNWSVHAAKDAIWDFDRKDEPFVTMNKGGSEGESLITHIRNGIAHGAVQIEKFNSKLYLDIRDYQDNRQKSQTAHIWIPVEQLFEIFSIYISVQEKNSDE